MKINFLAPIVFLVAALTACDQKDDYSQFIPVQRNGWEKNDHVVFAIPPIHQTSDYAMKLQLRTDNEFPFTSVVLIIDSELYHVNSSNTTTKANSHTTVSDTLVCRLADEQGHILGSGINIYQYSFPVRHLSLSANDSLQIQVHHAMKREMLPGIIDIGIVLEKSTQTNHPTP